MKILLSGLAAVSIVLIGMQVFKKPTPSVKYSSTTTPTPKNTNPLSISAMRSRAYPGSEIAIEEKLSSGSNYDQYIASYRSDGLKIHALLTVPQGKPPTGGWPIIVFNHGYIPP